MLSRIDTLEHKSKFIKENDNSVYLVVFKMWFFGEVICWNENLKKLCSFPYNTNVTKVDIVDYR